EINRDKNNHQAHNLPGLPKHLIRLNTFAAHQSYPKETPDGPHQIKHHELKNHLPHSMHPQQKQQTLTIQNNQTITPLTPTKQQFH
ncbi:hypothetical protein ACQWHJ_25060, partial [Salmonella enterica subsp. enterica serovar Infantis]